jgi:hypothetical protein
LISKLYLIHNATSRVNYSRSPQTVEQLVDLVLNVLDLGLRRRVADRLNQVRHRDARVLRRQAAESQVGPRRWLVRDAERGRAGARRDPQAGARDYSVFRLNEEDD